MKCFYAARARMRLFRAGLASWAIQGDAVCVRGAAFNFLLRAWPMSLPGFDLTEWSLVWLCDSDCIGVRYTARAITRENRRNDGIVAGK